MPSSSKRGTNTPTAAELEQALLTARRILKKAEDGVGHYPGRLEQINLARCFLWPEDDRA